MAVGIIAEYNPFHKGHAYQISEIRRRTNCAEIVAVMSGSFTQRGTPAILDKWTRAKLAVNGGVDLVLELPFVTAVRSAQDFARGGIGLLDELRIVDTLAFGAETSELSKLQAAALVFSEPAFNENLRVELSTGISYAAAVTRILARTTSLSERFLRQPNTILAIEYLRELPATMRPLLIPRIGAGYDDLTLREEFSSASAIRRAVREVYPQWDRISMSVDSRVLAALSEEHVRGFVNESLLLRPILAKLLTSSLDDLRGIYGMNEGLEFRLLKSARTATTFDELVSGIVSKRYPISRVKRLLLHFLIGLTADKIQEANYVRVLAFNERGRKLLRRIRAESKLPIITKVAQHLTSRDIVGGRLLTPYKQNLAQDILSTDLRAILFEVPRAMRQDFLVRWGH